LHLVKKTIAFSSNLPKYQWRHTYHKFYYGCHGFRMTNLGDYFWVTFHHFWSELHFRRHLGALTNISWEAPWSSGKCQLFMIWAMVLGRWFESRLHLKTWWKYGPLDGIKRNKKIKAAKRGKPHQKKYFFKQNKYKLDPKTKVP